MATLDLRSVQLFLFDIDGVILRGKTAPQLLSGRRILDALRARGVPFRLVTNTSTHSRGQLATTLQGLGLNVSPDQIHSALETTMAVAAKRYPKGRCCMIGEAGMQQLASGSGLQLVDEAPADVVVVGLSRQVDYRLLSVAARCLKGGAALLGCHRNRLWRDDDGVALSCGAWLAALEYATGVRAETFGKPAAAFFQAARAALGVGAAHTLMVGDDPESDIQGAQRAGLRAALALTGKTSRNDLQHLTVEPDLIIEAADDLADLLQDSHD